MTRFAEAFRSAYYGEGPVLKRMVEASAAAVGAPEHEDLEIGETRASMLACTFVDLRGFTKMALALPDEKTVRILQSVLVAATLHFGGFGGRVLDFTDGAMAVFERESHAEAVWDSLQAVAFILSDIRTVVNEDLRVAEDYTVRAAAGMEFGRVLWTRLGHSGASQLKPISGVSFLAGKNSQGSQTASWEALMGPGMSDFVPDDFKTRAKAYSFQFDNESYQFERWMFDWNAYLTAVARGESSVRASFAMHAPMIGGSMVRVPVTKGSRARQLRDEPYA